MNCTTEGTCKKMTKSYVNIISNACVVSTQLNVIPLKKGKKHHWSEIDVIWCDMCEL